MDSRKKSAPKHNKTLRDHCCTILSGYFNSHFKRLTRRLTAKRWPHLGCLNNVCSIPQGRKASQEKSCVEITAVDAPIDGRPIPPDTHRIQGFGQLAVTPGALLHSPLNQQFGLKAPLIHYLRLRLYQSSVATNRQGTSSSDTHFRQGYFLGGLKGQLKSILSHKHSSYLYLSPNYFEVKVNA
jgi:hypothetical protein